MKEDFKNILVAALVNLGDVVLATSALAILRQHFSGAKITMMVKPAAYEVVSDNSLVDEVIQFDYEPKKSSWGVMLKALRLIRRQKFDLAISLDRKLRPALLFFLAGIPTRLGPDKVFDDNQSRVTWLFTDTVHIAHDLETTHQAETYQAIVRALPGCTDAQGWPVMSRTRLPHEMRMQKLMATLTKERLIALCVKGTFPLKTWPKEYFCKVIDALAAKYDASFFIIGSDDDRSYAEEVIGLAKTEVRNFCGTTTIIDLSALIRQTDLLITVDTGAAHVAATTGVKMVTIYGCTSPKRWHPINDNAVVLTSSEPCSPCKCRPEECPSWPNPDCLWHIQPEQVIEEAVKLLGDK